MPRLICRLVAREGASAFPCIVVDGDGWHLRLTLTPPRAGLAPAGRVHGVQVWAEQVSDELGAAVVPEELLVIEEEEPFDEVGVRFGVDDDHAGIFDVPGRDRTGSGENTGHHSEEAAMDQQRTAVLAWIAATLGPLPADVPDTGACGPLKRRIADAPLDPLPPLDGVLPSTEALPRLSPAVLSAPPLGESTATQTEPMRDGLTLTSVVRPEIPRWPLFAAGIFAALAAFAWWWAG